MSLFPPEARCSKHLEITSADVTWVDTPTVDGIKLIVSDSQYRAARVPGQLDEGNWDIRHYLKFCHHSCEN